MDRTVLYRALRFVRHTCFRMLIAKQVPSGPSGTPLPQRDAQNQKGSQVLGRHDDTPKLFAVRLPLENLKTLAIQPI